MLRTCRGLKKVLNANLEPTNLLTVRLVYFIAITNFFAHPVLLPLNVAHSTAGSSD